MDGEGVFAQWFGNTVLYAVVGGIGTTVLAALAGYGFARFKFRGQRALFYTVLASLMVPVTAISLPLYFVFAKIHLINSMAGFILSNVVSVVAVYLMPRVHRRFAAP